MKRKLFSVLLGLVGVSVLSVVGVIPQVRAATPPPIFDFFRYIGQNDIAMFEQKIARDESGNIYTALSFYTSAYVMKFSPDGNSIIYETLIVRNGMFSIEDFVVDKGGNAYVAGHASAPAVIPWTVPPPSSPSPERSNAAIIKLDPNGSISYVKPISDPNKRFVDAIAVDDTGTVYVTGPDYFIPSSLDACYLAKIPLSSNIATSLLPIPFHVRNCKSIALDSSNENIFVAGITGYSFDKSTDNFNPIAGTHTPSCTTPSSHSCSDWSDAFLAKVNLNQTKKIYVTTFGGDDLEFPASLVIDSKGCAHITGSTSSRDFPTSSNAFQPVLNTLGNVHSDGFITTICQSGGGKPYVGYSTYLGGSEGESPHDIVLDSAENDIVVGSTNSPDFPLHLSGRTPVASMLESRFGFVTKLSRNAQGLLFSTYFGNLLNKKTDGGNADELSFVPPTSIYLVGTTGGYPNNGHTNEVNRIIGTLRDAYLAKLILPSSRAPYTLTPDARKALLFSLKATEPTTECHESIARAYENTPEEKRDCIVHTCSASTVISWPAPNGKSCIIQGNKCSIGQCQDGTCQPYESNDEDCGK